MTWDEYYEKINDWAVSTAVNKISSLEILENLMRWLMHLTSLHLKMKKVQQDY